MSDGFNIDVQGFDELKRKIQQLDNDPAKKREIKGILRQVAGSTISKAKQLVPVSERPHLVSGKRTRKIIQPGALQKSIGTIDGKRGAAVDNPTIYAGPRAKGSFDGFYGAMVESGHNVYKTSKSQKLTRAKFRSAGNKIGFVRGTFYMRKAFESTQGQVAPEAAEKVAKYIQRRIDRL